MGISRRNFLLAAAGGAAGALGSAAKVSPVSPWHISGGVAPNGLDCVLVQPDRFSWREATEGYRAALAGLGAKWAESRGEEEFAARTVVVPADVELERARAARLSGFARRGGRLLVESGAGFAEAGTAARERILAREYFGVELGAPCDLWKADRRVPYVDFLRPAEVKVRDFSRIVPVRASRSEIIARAGGVAVAARRRSGEGEVVFLGSPIGPALWAGDREARAWLAAFLTS